MQLEKGDGCNWKKEITEHISKELKYIWEGGEVFNWRIPDSVLKRKEIFAQLCFFLCTLFSLNCESIWHLSCYFYTINTAYTYPWVTLRNWNSATNFVFISAWRLTSGSTILRPYGDERVFEYMSFVSFMHDEFPLHFCIKCGVIETTVVVPL